MREIIFSEADVQSIAWERFHHPEPRVQRQMEILWLKHHGCTHQRITPLAGCCRSTVQRTLCRYLQDGLQQIGRVPTEKPHSQLDEHRV